MDQVNSVPRDILSTLNMDQVNSVPRDILSALTHGTGQQCTT